MKKYTLIYVIVLFCIVLTSCNEKVNNANKAENKMVIGHAGSESYSDDYVLYSKNEILHYFDTTNSTDTVICNKPQCTHTPPSSSNPTCDCDGYVGDSSCFIMDDDYLYYIYSPENSGFTTKNICRANKDGSNKKDIASFENIQNFLYGYYADGYLVFSYRNTFDENGEDLEKLESGFVYVDLSTGKASKSLVKKNYGATTYNMYIQNNKIYSRYSYETEKINFEKWENNLGDEFNEYISKITKYEIDCLDMDSKEEKVIYEGSGSCEISIGNGYACLTCADEIKYLNLNTQEEIKIDIKDRGYTSFFDGEDIILLNYEKRLLKKYSIDKNKIIDEVKFDSNNYTIPYLTSNYAYFWYTDEHDEFCLGRLLKEDFNKGEINSVEFLRRLNTED